MADSPDYKLRLQQLEERYKQLEERQKQAEERQKQAEERQKQAEDERRQAQDERRQAEERNRPTTLVEYMHHCHNLLSRPLRAEAPSRSTTGKIPPPTGKYCPARLEPWTDCLAQQQQVYSSVCKYLQPAQGDTPRLFPSLLELEGMRRRFSRAIDNVYSLKWYERTMVEQHVQDIIKALYNIPAARDEFGLNDECVDGVWFDDYTNSFRGETPAVYAKTDQFCFYRIFQNDNSILTSVKYTPAPELSVEALRTGLRPMNLWKDIVRNNNIPTEAEEKSKYEIERLVCSAIVQEYHKMIQEGLEYSYLTNGISRVLLRVPYEDPGTLYYFFCDPNRELEGEVTQDLQEPKTSIARVLCLLLMAFRSSVRSQRWRHAARSGLDVWTDHTHSQIPKEELQQPFPYSDSTNPEYLGPGSSSSCHDAQFCTQRCLLGLQTSDLLDDCCPNVKLHRKGRDDSKHPINAEDLVRRLKEQLAEDLDQNCTPFEGLGNYGLQEFGMYGAPFKLTYAEYSYTVVGKGTTSTLWKEVSREAQIYKILRKAQGSAVPVFLGTIDLEKTYFLHRAGEISHMLIMGWGGESTVKMELDSRLRHEIRRSNKEIKALGIIHEDLRRENILWNNELKRALIIDFHRSTLDSRPISKRSRSVKRQPSQTGESLGSKRLRVL